MAQEITLVQFETILNYLLDNNRRLEDEGKFPVTVSVCGDAGLGKTSIVRQIAQQRRMTFVKLNCSQLEETGDLIGLPIKQYKIVEYHETETGEKVEEIKWVASDMLQTYFQMPCENYEVTNEFRMTYATPDWLPRDDNPNGSMIIMDDWTRSNSLIIQALMEIINERSCISWNLPKYTNIVLTANPDNGDYNVNSIDAAAKS